MTGSGPRRLFSACAVLLLHLIVIAAFVFAFRLAPNTPAVTRVIELSFPAPARNPAPPPEIPPPRFRRPVMPRAVAPTIPETYPFPNPAPAPGALSGVGRALFGCDAATLDRLSPEARAACLRLPKGRSHEASLRIGAPPESHSPFSGEIEERFRQAQPINRPCPSGSYNDVRGLPCFGFDQNSRLLQGR